MSELIEKMARAICKAQWTRETHATEEDFEGEWPSYVDEARAVLALLADPANITAQMVEAFDGVSNVRFDDADNLREAIAAAFSERAPSDLTKEPKP